MPNRIFFLNVKTGIWSTLLVVGIMICRPGTLTAQESLPQSTGTLQVITRLAATGFSRSSEPEGYKAYSSIHFDISVRQKISRHLAVEGNLGHESREIDYEGGEEEISLGSVEMLPLNLSLQYHFGLKKINPYIGAGINYTVFWEKSGELNRKKLDPSFGPLLQMGVDIPITTRAILNLDLKSVLMQTEFEGPDKENVTLHIDPAVVGIGVGFAF